MIEEQDEESSTHPTLVTSDEVWQILNNQVQVQEQLRKKGQQTLQLLVATIVIATGASFVLDYNVSEEEIREAARDLPTTAPDLVGTLTWNSLIITVLIAIIAVVLPFFVARSYLASQPKSLHPHLGGRDDRPLAIIEDDRHQEFVDYESVRVSQYEEWVQANHETIRKKRRHLTCANINLIICASFSFVAAAIYININDVDAVWLLYIDALLLLLPLAVGWRIWKTRDDQPLSLKSLPITEQQKADFPYLFTPEFIAIGVLYTPIIALSFYVLQHYIRSYLSLLLEKVIRHIDFLPLPFDPII